MSSSPTAATSTTDSSSIWPSPPEDRTARTLAVIACGALARDVRLAAARSGRYVELHPLPAHLHNSPAAIAPAVERLARRLLAEGKEVAVAYADCGTYGRLDEMCRRLGLERLPGLHCYDLVAGEHAVAGLMEEEPGTYLLTDFLVASFDRLVVEPLGLDRRPELVADYFAHYRRVVWLTERPTPVLERAAARAAARLGLPLERRAVGDERVHRTVVRLLGSRRPGS